MRTYGNGNYRVADERLISLTLDRSKVKIAVVGCIINNNPRLTVLKLASRHMWFMADKLLIGHWDLECKLGYLHETQ